MGKQLPKQVKSMDTSQESQEHQMGTFHWVKAFLWDKPLVWGGPSSLVAALRQLKSQRVEIELHYSRQS